MDHGGNCGCRHRPLCLQLPDARHRHRSHLRRPPGSRLLGADPARRSRAGPRPVHPALGPRGPGNPPAARRARHRPGRLLPGGLRAPRAYGCGAGRLAGPRPQRVRRRSARPRPRPVVKGSNVKRALLAVLFLLPSLPALAQGQVWATFNGDLRAQKYSPETQITPQNVQNLTKAWEVHTGDVSDGSGDKPMSVWSATPLFVNDTLYVGTPFYRIFALDPGTGRVKWTFDPHAVLKALTQPDLKNRGVAYWQADNPAAGQACQKIVYIGTMDAKLYAVDADSGKPCAGFAQNGMLDVNH